MHAWMKIVACDHYEADNDEDDNENDDGAADDHDYLLNL